MRAPVPDATEAHAANKVLMARGSFSPEQVRLSRLLSRGVHIGPDSAGPDTAIELQLEENTDSSASSTASRWANGLTFIGPFGEIECAEGVRLLRALTGIDLGDAADGDPGRAWLDAAIIGRLAGTPFSRITRLSRARREADAHKTVLRLTLRSHSHALITHARADAQTWLDFMQGKAWTPFRAPVEEFLDLATSSRVLLARHMLPSHMLRALDEGDVIVPDSPAFSCDGTGSIRLANLLVRVRYKAPASLHILSTEINLDTHELDDEPYDDFDDDNDDGYDDDTGDRDAREDAGDDGMDETDDQYGDEEHEYAEESDDMSADEHSPVSDDDVEPRATHAASIDEVPITLEFELGKLRLPLGDLRSLAPGAVLTVEDGSPHVITIRSGGRKLGRGEAVNVDGQLGIRIIRWKA